MKMIMDTIDECKIIDGKLEVYLSPEEIAGILEAYPDVTIRIEK